MSSELQLDVRHLNRWRRHLVNAYEIRQAWCLLQVKLCDPCLSALKWSLPCKALYKCLTLPFTFYPDSDLSDLRPVKSRLGAQMISLNIYTDISLTFPRIFTGKQKMENLPSIFYLRGPHFQMEQLITNLKIKFIKRQWLAYVLSKFRTVRAWQLWDPFARRREGGGGGWK